MKQSSNKTVGAILYTRVSTDEQAQSGTSLSSQKAACLRKAEALGLPVVGQFSDEGISGGFLLQRPGLQAALADLHAGRGDVLIVANISRLSRDGEHQQGLLKAIRAAGAQVVFCDQSFDATPEGDLNFAIQGGFAAYEKSVIRKRTMDGRRRRAESGFQPGRTFAPFGYHIPSTGDVLRGDFPAADLGKYIVQEPAASLVRDMFAWYAEGRFSFAAMAKHLNTQGIPPPRGGRLWRCTSVRSILTNPAYKGEAVFGRHTKRLDESRVGQPHAQTGKPITSPKRYALSDDFVTIPCPPLVSEQLWDAVQERAKVNLNSQSGNPMRLRMLSGLVYCPGCGGRMVFKPARVRRNASAVHAQYCCYNHIKAQRLEGVNVCDAKTYRQSETEGAVVTALERAVQSPEWIEVALETYRKAKAMPKKAVDHRKELQAVDRALEQLGQEQQAAVRAQIAGIMQGASPDAYSEVFADVAARRKDLENRRGVLVRASRVNRSTETARQEQVSRETVLRDVHTTLTNPFVTDAEKRAFVGRVIEKVTCQKGGADVTFLPGLFGEVCAQAAREETTLSVFRLRVA